MTTLERVQRVVASVLQVPVERVTAFAPLYQISELDSMHLAEIAAGLDDEFQIRIPNDGLEAVQSVEDLVRLVEVSRLRSASE
jgi:acyl carrier protein